MATCSVVVAVSMAVPGSSTPSLSSCHSRTRAAVWLDPSTGLWVQRSVAWPAVGCTPTAARVGLFGGASSCSTADRGDVACSAVGVETVARTSKRHCFEASNPLNVRTRFAPIGGGVIPVWPVSGAIDDHVEPVSDCP